MTEPLDVRPAPQDGRAPDLHLVEGPDGRDTFVLGPGIEERARSGDPVALALVEIARLGPDGVYPSGWRVRDVFPELFAE